MIEPLRHTTTTSPSISANRSSASRSSNTKKQKRNRSLRSRNAMSGGYVPKQQGWLWKVAKLHVGFCSVLGRRRLKRNWTRRRIRVDGWRCVVLWVIPRAVMMAKKSWYVEPVLLLVVEADGMVDRPDMGVQMTRSWRIWMRNRTRVTLSSCTFTIGMHSRGTLQRGRVRSVPRCGALLVCLSSQNSCLWVSDFGFIAGWNDERLEDWARLMDRNVSPLHQFPARIIDDSVYSPGKTRSSVDTHIPGTTTTHPLETTRIAADEAEEGLVVEEKAVALAEKATAQEGAEADRTRDHEGIRMQRGREGMIGRCRRLLDGRRSGLVRWLCIIARCCSCLVYDTLCEYRSKVMKVYICKCQLLTE
jgi:hypothetical protein